MMSHARLLKGEACCERMTKVMGHRRRASQV
jgi:hypothetical protein